MLASSLKDGVAKNGYIPGYTLAWKTWTAEIPYKGIYETWPWYTNASFAGFGPIEDPRFTIVIKLERPRTTQYGWASSAFLFKEVASYLLDYYEIPKRQEEE
jgi:cell division protein FtsI (penicillin-binding protein 3)